MSALKEKYALISKILEQQTRDVSPESRVRVLFSIFLGRKPSAEDVAYYSKKISNDPRGFFSSCIEIARSPEAGTLGMADELQSFDLVGESQTLDIYILILMSVGLMVRRQKAAEERFSNIEDLAKLTLLTIPEIAGDKHASLLRRVEILETAIAMKDGGERI